MNRASFLRTLLALPFAPSIAKAVLERRERQLVTVYQPQGVFMGMARSREPLVKGDLVVLDAEGYLVHVGIADCPIGAAISDNKHGVVMIRTFGSNA